MTNPILHSITLELTASNAATIAVTMGHQIHAMLLDLVRRDDPTLSAQLHEGQQSRPFTVGPLTGGRAQGDSIVLRSGQGCRLRFTLLDGGRIWQCLNTHFLEAGPITLRVGAAEFVLTRMLATPTADPSGWAGYSDWQTLANTAAARYITLRFASPTAFSIGDKRFSLFPEPQFVWESLARVWNNYAPPPLHLDKPAISEFVKQRVVVADYDLRTATLHYPSYTQKGFLGTCTYLVQEMGDCAARLAALAEFARYAGVGYKTTMGMGQCRADPSLQPSQVATGLASGS